MADAAEDDTAEQKTLAPVLWLSLVVMVVSPFLAPTVPGRVATVLLVGGTAVVALRRSGARRPVVLAGEAVVVLLVAMSAMSRELGDPDNTASVVALVLMCLLLLVTPGVVVLRLSRRPRVTLDTVAGALAAYIQLGLLFAAGYQLVGLVQTAPFFSTQSDPSLMDYQFFSFVTLTTLGYGNLVPGTDVGQSLAMLEAVMGQVFLVTVVAMAVSNIGRVRTPRS